jgi:oligopeptidase B
MTIKTKTLKKIFKQRNLTKKSYQYFKDNLTRYLSPDEVSKLQYKNDLIKYIKPNNINLKNHTILHNLRAYNNYYQLNQKKIGIMAEKIKKGFHSFDFKYSEDSNFLIRGHYNKETNYLQLTTNQQCNDYDILNLHELGKHFPFFQVSKMELSPSNEKMLLSIDFIGSQVYHLFIKNLYSNEIHEIKIPKQTMKPTHDVLGGTTDTNSTQEAIWLDDTRIAYVSIDRYYNDSGVYMYDLKTGRHKLLYKGKHGYFISLSCVDSGLYILIIVSNYNNDEIYIMDTETYIVRKKPLLKRRYSVRYPYINHNNGTWFLQIQDKGTDSICFTKDFIKYESLYKNTNPYEQILDVEYGNNTFLFTLSTLKCLKLYALKCGKLKLLQESDVDYFSIEGFTSVKNEFMVYRHKYTCPHKEQIVSTDSLSITPVTMTPKYVEKEIYIRPHLRVTLIYKDKLVKNSRCLLRGYGAYNTYEHATYSHHYFPLLEEGFVIAVAHLRGGAEYGYKGYDEGRFTNKKNTFLDFIETAKYLIQNEYTSKDRLAIWGRSCGGLLITSVLNMCPDLCKVAIIGVPFVSPIETMKTYKTPLGIETQSELGDPKKTKVINYIHTYAPLENIKSDGDYPHMFIYTNLNDTLVPYVEPVKYYNCMKNIEVYKSGKKDITLHVDFRFGHKQGTLLKDRSEHYAMLFTYLLDHL